MASLNLSKNAKRAAYAHISFNIIGVTVMLPLFFLSMGLLQWAMGFFGGDPSVAVMRDGKETFPLVPVAVGLYSTAFNVFNTALLFPFIGVFERVLARVGRTTAEDAEDYSVTRFLDRAKGEQISTGRPARPAGDGALRSGQRALPGDRPQGQGVPPATRRSTTRRSIPQPRHPPLHRGDVQAQHAARAGRPAGEPD